MESNAEKRSCYRCNHLRTQGEKAYWCREGGLAGEIIQPNGKGKLTLWQKMELYRWQGNATELSRRMQAEADRCESYDNVP